MILISKVFPFFLFALSLFSQIPQVLGESLYEAKLIPDSKRCVISDRIRSLKGDIQQIDIYFNSVSNSRGIQECSLENVPVVLRCDPAYARDLDAGGVYDVSLGTVGGRRIAQLSFGGDGREFDTLVGKIEGWANAGCRSTKE